MSEFIFLLATFCFVIVTQCATFTASIYFLTKKEKLGSAINVSGAEDQDEEEEEEPFAFKFTSNPNIRRNFDQELKDLEKEMEVDVDDPNNESGKW